MKKYLALLCVMALGLSVTACGSKEKETEAPVATTADTAATETTAKENDTEETLGDAEELTYTKLIVGVDDTFAPMGFRDENNEIVGFDIDLMKAVGEELGVEIEVLPIEWSMKEMELNQGNIDLIWNGYTITESRKQEVNFTNAYLDNSQVALVLADSEIMTLADLEGKVVVTQTDSSGLEAILAMPEVSDTFKDLIQQDTYDMCFLELEGERSDAIVGDSVLIDYIVAHKEDPSKFRVLEEDFGSEEYGIGVRKDDTALLNAVNTAIENLKASGKAAEISVKWFGDDIVK